MAKILIVDDEWALSELLLLIVEDSGHEGLVAHNGLEGLRLAQQSLPDLIISDVMMPLMSGLELVAAIRADAQLAPTPVVLISAAPAPISMPVVAVYLCKPLDIDLLEQVINRLISEHA